MLNKLKAVTTFAQCRQLCGLLDDNHKAMIKSLQPYTKIAYHAAVLGSTYMYAREKRLNPVSRGLIMLYGLTAHEFPVSGGVLIAGTGATLGLLQKNGFAVSMKLAFTTTVLAGVVMAVGVVADEMVMRKNCEFKAKPVRTNWDNCDSLVVHEPTDTLCYFGSFNDCETWAGEHNADSEGLHPYHAIFLNDEMRHLAALEWNPNFISNKPDGWTGK